MWKTSLETRLKQESNEKIKDIYVFVMDNLENAPFVLKQLEGSQDKIDILKHKELKRTFEKFSGKLKTYVENKTLKKQESLRLFNERKEFQNMKRIKMTQNKKRCLEKIEEEDDHEHVKKPKSNKYLVIDTYLEGEEFIKESVNVC
jgi:hypothetical protein